MSKAVNSPTARLLQSSRLFSLPRPLPAPDHSGAVSGSYKLSDTATTPYPIHQAISTPASSLHRGDWGLKRSLPQKRLRGTNPTVRIRAQDTWEHVTSFESAGDHVRTLQKWGEMGVPMLIKKRARRQESFAAREKPESVYDDAYDVTDKGAGAERWKYGGPWLSGMQEGDFQQWLAKQVGSRHGEWLEFLRQHETEYRVKQARAEARDAGNPMSAEEVEQLRAKSRPSDAELVDIQKQLRDDHREDRLSSELTVLITNFLDLPVVPQEGEEGSSSDRFMGTIALASGLSTERAPPSTHPGAGLSHIRTNAIMENHPIHGPQASRAPVQARVVRPQVTAGMATEYQAKLGVGGVVADDSVSSTMGSASSKYKRTSDVAHSMDPNIVGGGKVWVQPRSAIVDEKGRIQLRLSRADREAIAVRTNDVEEIHEQKRQSNNASAPARPTGYTGSQYPNYGAGLPDTRRMYQQREEARTAGPRPNVKGFDDALGESGHGQAATGVADILRRGL